jgi:tetratricopeptide (TPR) repeat protein
MDVIAELLAEQGPLTDEQLLARLHGRGGDLAQTSIETVEDALGEDDASVMPLADGRWALLPALLADRVFTHRVSGREVEHDVLDLSPDLDPVAILTESETFSRLTDGSPLAPVLGRFDANTLAEWDRPEDAIDDHGSLLLARGQLAGLGVGDGDVIGLRLTSAGLTLGRIPEPVAASETLERLRKRLDEVISAHEPVELNHAIWTVCAGDPTLFTEPLPPVGEILDACGLTRHGDWLASDGFDFARWRAGSYHKLIASRYDLSDDESLAVVAVVTMYEQVAEVFEAVRSAEETSDGAALASVTAHLPAAAESPPVDPEGDDAYRDTVRSVVALLAEPTVAETVLAETIGRHEDGAAALGLFAETLEPLAPRAAKAPLRWLRARAYERLGHIEEAEAAYQAAESLDPDWPLTLVDLARYASDRGDAGGGLSLLRRADAPPGYPLVEVLEHFQARPRPELGRNQPCWCGSGLKYKKCHLRNEQLPLEERAAWLYQKAGRYVLDGAWDELLFEVATVRAHHADSPDAVREALNDPLVCDAVLFEGGAFTEFLTTRGVLLPDDERLLAEQWTLVDRSVYEISNIRRGDGFSARDLRTGDTHDVRDRTASRQLRAGQLVCARIVPTGDTMQVFGGLEPVALHERDDLVALLDSEPGPLELVAFLTRRFAPPALANTEGEPLVLCESTLHVTDPAEMSAVLDKQYDRDEAERARWFEHVTTHGMERIRATLLLDGDQLHVHTNSEARHERVLTTLRGIDPSIAVVTESRQSVSNTREAAKLFEQLPGDGEEPRLLDASEPEVAAALEGFTRDCEQTWLDEPIPALAGHTPRQAAADPHPSR